MKVTLSVSMIVRNESAHIATALENLHVFADEVVVLDTGSTDDTKRLATEAGAIVRDFVWCDDFAKARNASLSLCTKDFVMWLDADDRVPEEDASRLRELLEGETDWDVLYLPYMYSHTMRKKPPRVFRNGLGIRWIYPIHEILSYPKPMRRRRDVDDICVYHSPKPSAGANSPRNIRILEKAILLPEFENSSYMLWHLAKEYSALRDQPKAIHYFRQAAACAPPGETFMVSRQYTGLARQYRRRGQMSQAAEELGKAALFYPRWREPYCGMADAFWAMDDAAAARACVEMARDISRHHFTVERIALYDDESFTRDYVEKARRLSEAATARRTRRQCTSPAEHVLTAGGDVCLARQIQGYVSKHGADWPFRDVRDLFDSADVALVNLECVVANTGEPFDKQGRRPFYYRAHPGMLEVLRSAGVDVVTTANNHSMDYGQEALLQNNALLVQNGIRQCGSGASFVEATSPCYLDVDGIVIAVISIDTEEKHFAATASTPGVNHAKGAANVLRRLAVSMAEARNRADLIVVSPHWGANWKEQPTEERTSLARSIIDLGADAILGHSAHILQGVEIYAACPIVYDMGSLLFDRVSESRMNLSAIFTLPFDRDGFTHLRAYPVVLERGRVCRAQGRQFDEICSLLRSLSEPLGTTDWAVGDEWMEVALDETQKWARPPRTAAPVNDGATETASRVLISDSPDVVLDSPPPWSEFLSNEEIVLTGSRIPDAVRPGYAYVAEVLLRVPGPLVGRWEGRIQAFNREGEPQYSWVHPIADGATCPTQWRAGQIVLDRTVVRPPRNLPEGTYELFFCLVDRDSKRSICPLSRSRRMIGDEVLLGTIEVTTGAPSGVAGLVQSERRMNETGSESCKTASVSPERTTGPVVLGDNETAFLDSLRGALLSGSPTVADARSVFGRSGLPQEFWGFALTLYQAGTQRMMVVRAAPIPSLENIRSVMERALVHSRFGEFDLADRERCRMQIDFIVDEPAAVEFDSLAESTLDGNRFEFGIDGLRIVGPERRRYILPGDAFVSSILGLGQLRQRVERLFPDTPIDQLEFYRFQSVSYVSTADGWIRLYRGLPAVTPATKEAISDAAMAGVNWIVNNCHPDGRFVYYYDAATDSHRDHEHPSRDPETDPYYNLLRHCGGVITMLLAHGLRTSGLPDMSLKSGRGPNLQIAASPEAIEAGIDFFTRQLVPYTTANGSSAAYAYYNRKAKLGGSGIGLYMLALYQKLFRSATYAEQARLLANHLLNEILDSGEFRYYHVYLDRKVTKAENPSLFSFYYPGEAIIGLANYCQHVCDSDAERDAIYDRIHQSLQFLFVERPRIYREHYTSLPADSWLMMGINDLWEVPQFQQEAYSRPVFQDADQMVDHMYTPHRAPYPDYAGSFYYDFGDHPYPDGARAEGLLAAYLLSRKVGDRKRTPRYLEALRLLAWATLRLCNTRDSVYSVPNPERTIGGIRFKLTRQWFRVDTIQHVASFYLKFLPYFQGSAGVAGTAANRHS